MGGGPQFPPSTGRDSPVDAGKAKRLHAVVDMGSNGIRCSITDLSAPTTRILPTVYAHRVNISLYEAQFDDRGDRIPIPQSVIQAVIGAILRFQIVCLEMGVPARNTRIMATEATRTAPNASEFMRALHEATGIAVKTLTKAEEGVVGAWGIASGFSQLAGLALDLGGGSMQMTWIVSNAGQVVTSPHGAVSFPYGAAALTRTLEELEKGRSKEDARRAKMAFRRTVEENFRRAWKTLDIPQWLLDRAQRDGGFQVYLSGGGFRGWGYLLLYRHQARGEDYPLSIINGYSAPKEDFENTRALKEIARTARKIFRVSDRRRKQVPSVAFLINALAEAVPHGIREAHFCQGGVREGLLFRTIPPMVRQQDPLTVATRPFARPSAQALAGLLVACIPRPTADRRFPPSVSDQVLQALANALYVHAALSTELSSAAALYSTGTGVLSGAHGVPHADRARLALMLQERYGGELPRREQAFRDRLRDLLTPEEAWWMRCVGKVALVLARVYPLGVVDTARPRLLPLAEWADDLGSHGDRAGIALKFAVQKVAFDPTLLKQELAQDIRKIQKVGKRKNWIGGRDGWGMKVKVKLVEEDLL
ncbi:putative transcription regulator (RTG2) [Aspergillus affinis]|uniref:putative transcription regulator (RTG2) n=1 Tax=Aspergillus affinis TaxID=1070780 RepID=UPI0022FEE2EA|nr:putative transcription regulator [Aspergillus affinis]KAI9036535.1 putative transcription regulator [Aspergillus affinis]